MIFKSLFTLIAGKYFYCLCYAKVFVKIRVAPVRLLTPTETETFFYM